MQWWFLLFWLVAVVEKSDNLYPLQARVDLLSVMLSIL